MTYQEQIAQKHQQIFDITKAMRIAMQDALAANDPKFRQGYWNIAESWGRRVDAAMVELNLLELNKYHETKIHTAGPLLAVDTTAGAIEGPYADQHAEEER